MNFDTFFDLRHAKRSEGSEPYNIQTQILRRWLRMTTGIVTVFLVVMGEVLTYDILNIMELRKYRWSRSYESAEEELESILAAKQIAAVRWVATENQSFAPMKQPDDKRLWCVEGSIVFNVSEKVITLQAGDALDLPASTIHSAKAGFSGCVCYESPVPILNPVTSPSTS